MLQSSSYNTTLCSSKQHKSAKVLSIMKGIDHKFSSLFNLSFWLHQIVQIVCFINFAKKYLWQSEEIL